MEHPLALYGYTVHLDSLRSVPTGPYFRFGMLEITILYAWGCITTQITWNQLGMM